MVRAAAAGGPQRACLSTVVGGPSPATAASVPWFPVVGAGLGAFLGVAWWALDEVLPFVAAGGVVAADLALTGMLHLDGWIDSADGPGPDLERDHRLVVMSEPEVGAFGVGSAVVVIALRMAARLVTEDVVSKEGPPPRGLWATSRALMGLATLHLPYARQSGMVSAYGARPGDTGGHAALPPTLACVFAILAAAAALVGWRPRAAPAVLAGRSPQVPASWHWAGGSLAATPETCSGRPASLPRQPA